MRVVRDTHEIRRGFIGASQIDVENSEREMREEISLNHGSAKCLFEDSATGVNQAVGIETAPNGFGIVLFRVSELCLGLAPHWGRRFVGRQGLSVLVHMYGDAAVGLAIVTIKKLPGFKAVV